jgi:hypothetical protein
MKFSNKLVFLCVLSFARSSLALTCNGCEVMNETESCNFSYKCPKGTDYCETLVSKVEGVYSVILSCATMEKCGLYDPLKDEIGLQKCDHSK